MLREQCGDRWTYKLGAADLNIKETVTLTVPRLLPETTIKAVTQRLEARRTYLHGNPKHQYLLNGRVFCDDPARNAVGSSRVDLQACKLEYSIVSPK